MIFCPQSINFTGIQNISDITGVYPQKMSGFLLFSICKMMAGGKSSKQLTCIHVGNIFQYFCERWCVAVIAQLGER